MEAHEIRIDISTRDHLDRKSRHERDPVNDFLFEYYNFRPAQLRRWSPGLGIVLTGLGAKKFLERPEFEETDEGVCLSATQFPRRLYQSTVWIRDLLVATEKRPPYFGCAGMHEWAMVYGAGQVRHPGTRLRFSRQRINEIVEENVLSCMHFDAFRFFSDAARALNHLELSRSTMITMEQPGCLHSNMDLYKWAFKRFPWVDSDLIADAFFLACRIRQVDMRASPYNLSSTGLKSIPVETAEGRSQYRSAQRAFNLEAQTIRRRLISAYETILKATGEMTT